MAFILIMPYVFLGSGVYLPVSDNMDSNLAWWKMLKESGSIWKDWNHEVPGMIIQSPRFTYPSGLNLEALLYYFFPILPAYMINKLLIFGIGFGSFYFWLRLQSHERIPFLVQIGFSLLWASLAFYIHRGISIAALPALVGIFQLFLSSSGNWKYLIGLIAYAFYSKLVLAGFYFWIGLLLWVTWKCIVTRKIFGLAIFGLFILMGTWLVLEYQLIRGLFLNPNFESHRIDFSYDFGIWVNQWPWEFFLSGDQNGVYYSPLYLFIIVCLLIWAKISNPFYQKGLRFFLMFLSLSILLAILSSSGLLAVLGKWIPVLASFNLLRFEYWIPFLLFASLFFLWRSKAFAGFRVLLPLLLLMNIFVYQYEWRYWINDYFPLLSQKVLSYQEYYSEKEFGELKEFIGEDVSSKRFLHFNIPPAVSAYNGLISLDGYLQVYDRKHKMEVFEVIQDELAKDNSLRRHFYNWGNKCYFQNAQFPDDYFMYKWREEDVLIEPDYDYVYLKEVLKADYILSALPVSSSNFKLLKVFEGTHSAWRIHLYELDR